MKCGYCHSINDAEDTRCGRCGRRLLVAASGGVAKAVPPAAPKAIRSTSAGAAVAAALEPPPVARALDPQPALFPANPPKARVVPISSTGLGAAPAQTKQKPRPAAPRRGSETAQQQLAFVTSPPAPNPRRTSEIESEIFCAAPVAASQHRAMALIFDLGMIALAVALMTGVFFAIAKPQIALGPVTLAALAGMTFGVAVLYQTLWALGNGDSPGLRFARLRLVDFDGRPPTRDKRVVRLAASWLSAAPALLGVVWALVDEESLTWHDHISKVFPTPAAAPTGSPFEQRANR
jgi:uncharacterized RDD family membrane protein YckC